jgi:hypothetical protein
VIYCAYDQENLYFAFRCFDSEPNKIKASISGRDTIKVDDWICINLDSFDDQQSLYALYVNPLGIQGDSRFEGGQEDSTVDVVWYSAGKINADGYKNPSFSKGSKNSILWGIMTVTLLGPSFIHEPLWTP